MKISLEAIKYVQELMKESEIDTLRFFLDEVEEGEYELGITLEEAKPGDAVEVIESLKIAVAAEVLEEVQKLAIDVDEEGLVIEEMAFEN